MESFWQRLSQPSPPRGDGEQRQDLHDSPKVREPAGISPGPLGEWTGLAKRGLSPFDPEFGSVSGILAPNPAQLPVLNKTFPETYLPIEALRDDDFGASLFCGTSVERVFRSSGTTASSRSTSRYSGSGLKAYRWASLYTFRYVLSCVLGREPEGIQGYSLIPPVASWPDSSLAQMVAWISEVCPVSYLTAEDFSSLFPQANQSGAKPVWLFATAFHLVDLIDQGHARQLPPGSVVIETGGTKGKTRSVTRDELYGMVERALGVPADKIVSEYGMCELASQAYDFVDPSETDTSPAKRYFRFPAWVQLSALTEIEKAVPSGQGALLVGDPMRVDHPWPLRTEDLVSLESVDGKQVFQLLGRLERAPLKGCSLLAEVPPSAVTDTLVPTARYHGDDGKSPDDPKALTDNFGVNHSELLSRARSFLQSIERWVKESSAPRQALAAELGSLNAANFAIQDIFKSLPPDPQALVEAALRSRGHEAIPKKWMLILPRSHSLVGLYPLALGYVLGLSMKVRLSVGIGHETSFIRQYLRMIQDLPGADVALVPSSFRLRDGQVLQDVDAVLAYGDDETLDQLASFAGRVPVRGFGGRLGISVLSAEQYEHEVPCLVRDALTLGQLGCMATRLVLVHDEGEFLRSDKLAEAIFEEMRAFWRGAIPWQTTVALDAEAYRYKRLGFERPYQRDEHSWPLVVVKKATVIPRFEIGGPEVVARVPMTLPIILVQGCSWMELRQSLSEHLESWPSLASFSVSAGVLGDPVFVRGQSHFMRRLGEANSPLWDGTHEGFPLFAGPVVS